MQYSLRTYETTRVNATKSDIMTNATLKTITQDIARTWGIVNDAVTLRFRLVSGEAQWTVTADLGDGEVLEGRGASIHEATLNARHRQPMTIDRAPIHYSNEEAHAWLAGCEHGRSER